ncbi:MAG: AI-2E family transporter [Candidatus Gracilibacteria bacterium]|nr:AI-2E family transporter [Candidatus Gracilibacteria bacterium]
MKIPPEETVQGSDSLVVFTQKALILLSLAAGLYMLYSLSSTLAVLFFSGFLTILFSPLLDSMNRKRIPDWLGILFIFLGILFFFFVALFAIIPIFAKQITLLFSYVGSTFSTLDALYKSGGVDALGFPSFLKSYISTVDFGTLFEFVQNNISSISGIATTLSKNLFQGSTSIVSSVSGGIFQGIMIGVFTFFMSLERHAIREFIHTILPGNIRMYVLKREGSFLQVLSSWMRGQIILCASIFGLTLIGLLCLKLFGIHIDDIFTLALIAGLMEFIPYIGPFLALLPALAIAAGLGITPIIAVLVLYIIIQQTENNILVPMVMSKSLNLSPFLILLMMTVMASLLGIVGILLAIPFAAILQILVKDFTMGRKSEETNRNLTKKEKSI